MEIEDEKMAIFPEDMESASFFGGYGEGDG